MKSPKNMIRARKFSKRLREVRDRELVEFHQNLAKEVREERAQNTKNERPRHG